MSNIPQPFTARVDKEEDVFLQSFMPQYELHQVKKNYREFWPGLMSAYSSKFPLLEKLWPNSGKTLKDLDDADTELYTPALLAKQNVRPQPSSKSLSDVVTRASESGSVGGRTPVAATPALPSDQRTSRRFTSLRDDEVTRRMRYSQNSIRISLILYGRRLAASRA